MKKFIVKLSLLLLVTFFCQYLLTHYLLRIDDPRLKEYVFRFDEFTRLNHYLEEKIDIVYFGDSSIYTLGSGDKDKRSIARMTADKTPQYSLGELSHAAYHIDIYAAYCRYIARQGYHPEAVVIPINIGTFSPYWDKRPQYQFEKEKMILEGGIRKQLLQAFYKPLMALDYNFYTISREEFLNAPVFNGTRQVGIVSDFNNSSYRKYSERNMKNRILFFYMFSLSPQHRKLKSLVETAGVLARHNIEGIFYFTPIDYETGEKYFPGLFTRRLKENADVIRSLLAAEGVEVLDLSTGLPADSFSWGLYPNEHLNQKGRRYVAEKVSRRIDRLSR
ncbi:MAG: hypothetical protein GY950_35975 [bacterium]|nr:hypothetical protein [bacterium]